MAGSGKSRLATRIASAWHRVLVYDPKHDAEATISNATIAYTADAALRALPGRVIYRPGRDELGDIARHFDRLVARTFDLGSHAIVIHELGDLADGNRIGPALSQATRQGRSRFVPIVFVTQRPLDIPRVAVTESGHAFLFHLIDPRDRAVVAGWMGERVRAAIPKDYSFWYRDPRSGLHRCAPVV